MAAASVRPGLLLVEARLVGPGGGEKVGEAGPRLVIDRAVAAPGALPRLLDDERLGGLIELVDGDGEILWSMHYRPLADAGEGTRLRLRAPLLEEARAVRLSEPGRGLAAETRLGE